MIFTLSEAFDQLEDEQWQPFLCAVENLLTAHASGWHLFVPSRPVLERLLGLNVLSVRYRTMLEVQIGENLSTLWGQALSAHKRVVCTIENGEGAGQGLLHVPLRSYDGLDECMRSRLVVENANTDGVFYVRLASRLGAEGVSLLRLSLEVVHGGGDTTAGRVAEAVASARPALVIVDGDKSYPTAPEGTTARHVRENFESSGYQAHVLHVTSVRSAENYVPMPLAHAVMASRIESRKIVEALAQVIEEEKQTGCDLKMSVVAHVSAKRGVKVGHYRKACAIFRQSVDRLLVQLGVEWSPPANDDVSRDGEQLCRGINAHFLEIFTQRLGEDEDFGAECEREFPSGPFFEEIHLLLKDVVAFGMAASRLPVDMEAA